jgi:hypothetical protein
VLCQLGTDGRRHIPDAAFVVLYDRERFCLEKPLLKHHHRFLRCLAQVPDFRTIIVPVFLYSIRVRMTSERQTALGATDEDLSDSSHLWEAITQRHILDV